MTSMPASRAATAICSAPLEWPSRPGLPTRSLGGPPWAAMARTVSRTAAMASASDEVSTPLTPVGARNSPNTSRRAPAHSPTVPPASARAMVASMMLPVPSAVVWSRSMAAADPGGVAVGLPLAEGLDDLGLDGRVDHQDAAVVGLLQG